jgi:aldehyde dehydrogenase (NAD(P)+)
MLTYPDLDRSIQELNDHKDGWLSLPIQDKLDLLVETRDRLIEMGPRLVEASVAGKRIDPQSPWVGEEWILGPWALAEVLNGYLDTLRALAAGQVAGLKKISTRANGQVVAQVFPNTFYDRLILSGLTAEVWMQPGVTPDSLREHTAVLYRQNGRKGKVALVLSSGNVSAIPVLDVFYRFFAFGHVVILKMNPVNDYLGPVFEDILAPFVRGGFLRFAYGGAEVGEYLTHHPGVDEIHITGNSRTHDVIVFGPGPEGQARKERNEPALEKPITSELNCICPTIIVPGRWSKADIRFQAENVVTMKLNNSGFNCSAMQVLVMPSGWQQHDEFLDAIRTVMHELPPRHAYYPGAAERQKAILEVYPTAETFGGDVPRTLIPGLDAEGAGDYCYNNEFFGPVLAQTDLPGTDIPEYLRLAVSFCNDRLRGTLGATLIAHPATLKRYASAVDETIAGLRYGSIGINVWHSMAFLLGQTTWGAYPGHTYTDIQSGIGVVRNSFLFDKPEKTVCFGAFYPFPRGLAHGSFSILPKPPWFITNKAAHITLKKIARFSARPGLSQLPGIFIAALMG